MSKNTQCYTTPVRLEGPGNPLPAITENVSNEAKSLALLRAIESRNYKIIPYLLEEGADINYHDNNGKSALHEACAQKNIHLIRLLVVKGADVNYSSNNYGCTFHKICEFANAEDINSLIIKYHADVNKLDHNGETVLKRACMRGNIEVAKLLIEHGAIDDSIEYMRPMTTMQAYIAAHEWCKNAFFKATPEYGHLSTEAKTIMKKIVANKFIHDHYTQQEINNFFVFHRTSEILANARDDIINRVSNGNVDSYKQSNTYQDSSKDSLCLETKKRANENPDEPLTNKVAKTDSYASSEGIKKPTTKVHNKQLLVLDAGLYHKPPNSNKISNQGARNKPSIADKALLDAVWSGKPEECLQALRAGVSEEAKNNALM
ncbi:MAG: ankyrin repeat domain-containing protein, partial [Rickettsiaceae bacterium]|nr:ankyrin repeat domain-containing protein [Rickettsiaceae bacterium]